MRPVVFTGDIFRHQERGGITRYFTELIPRLRRPATVLAGLHCSAELGRIGSRARLALRVPSFRGDRLVLAPFHRVVDLGLGLSRGILHVTYYRSPGQLPARPLVVTIHDMIHERYPDVGRRARWIPDPARHKAALVRRADRLVCYSESGRQDAIALLGAEPARVRVIPLASRDWSRVRAEPIEGVRQPFLLWVGERHTYKNFLPTLEAVSEVAEARDHSVLCVGGGPLGPRERERAAAWDLSDRLRQVACGDGGLRWAYERATALLYTSLWEGFGLPVLEALSLGCPVLTSRRSSLPEVAGDCAEYVDVERPECLREGVQRALRSGRDAGQVAARRAQAARFSWEACAEAHERLYAELDG